MPPGTRTIPILLASTNVIVVASALYIIMGNLCGKQSDDSDPFSQPGRTIGSAPQAQQNPRAGVPKIKGPGQTLGGSTGSATDARSAAARAAEVSR